MDVALLLEGALRHEGRTGMKRAIISFLILLAATPIWLRLFPETGKDEAQVKSVHFETRSWGDSPEEELQKRVEEYLDIERLFPDPNDWRRQDPVFISYEETYFVFLKRWPQYDPRRNDVPIEVCTFVWLPPATPDQQGLDKEEIVATRSRRAIVLEMEDVVIAFNRNIGDFLTSVKRGGAKLEPTAFKNAQVRGNFVVRGGDETDEKNLNFSFRTRGVLLSPKQLRSNSKFTFQIGPHYGAGQGLSISFSVPTDLKDYLARSQQNEIEEAQTDEERETAFLNKTFHEGNIGSGISIESVELSNIDLIHLFPSAFRFDAGGKRSSESVDELEVGCQKGVHFERTANQLGEWRLRFDGDVDAILKSNMERICRLKGDSFFLFFQDHEMLKLATSNFPSVRSRTLRTKPSGKLARLQTTGLLITGEDAPLTLVYVPASSDPTKLRTVKVQAMRALYNVEKREFKLQNTLNGPGSVGVSAAGAAAYDSHDVSSASIAPVIVTVTETVRGGSSSVSSLKSPMIVANFDENSELASLRADQDGVISTNVTNAKNETINVETTWGKELRILPVKGDDGLFDGVYQMTASGTTRCVAEGIGSFEAKEANFWFRLAQADNAPANASELYGGGNSSLTRFSMKPICAKFTEAVKLETERGSMRIRDLVKISFSDQSGLSSGGSLVASNSGATSMDGFAESLSVGADGSESTGTFEVEGDHLDLECELLPASSGRGTLRLIRAILAGNARFQGDNAEGEVVASLDSDCVIASNPLTPEMKFHVWSLSKNATLNLNGMNLEGKRTYVDAARNTIQIYGPGKVALQPSTQKLRRDDSQSSTALDSLGADSFLVEWTGGLIFDGNYLRFLSNSTVESEESTAEAAALAAEVDDLVRSLDPVVAGEFTAAFTDPVPGDEDGVRLTMSDGYLVCDETRVTPKEHIDLFNFKTDGDSLPEIDYVECISHATERPVVMHFQTRSPEENAVETFNGFYNLQCSGIRVDWNDESFTVERGGYLEATLLSNYGGVSSLDAGGVAKGKAPTSEKTSQWVRVSAEFGLATGLLKESSVKVTEGVRALLCDVAGPNVRATLFNSSTWPDQSIVFNSSEATYRLVSTPENTKGTMEADARGNVTFRLGEYTGTCESLSYTAMKNLLTLSGSGNAKARIVQQAYSGAPRTVLAEFMAGRIRLGTDMKLEVEGGEIKLNDETLRGMKNN